MTDVVIVLEPVVPVLSDAVVRAVAFGINVEVWGDVMTASLFRLPIPNEEFSCRTRFGCWRLNVGKSLSAAQARKPSDHVWGNSMFPALPQFRNQEPP